MKNFTNNYSLKNMKKIILSFLFLVSCARGNHETFEDDGAGADSSYIANGSGAATSVASSNSSTSNSVTSTTGSSNSVTIASSSSGEMVCVPGTTQLCNGPGACFGAQSCNSDGMSYGDCICSSSSSDVTSAGITSAGVTTGGQNFTCDPLNPAIACGSGKQCLPQTNGEPICAPAGNGNFFDLCVDFSQCLPGLDCVNEGVNSCCMAWCRLGYNDCPNGFSCVEVLGNPSIDGVIYGICWDGLPCIL